MKKMKDYLKPKGKFYGYCHCCHKFGHKATECITKGKDQTLKRKQETDTEDNKGQLSKIPHQNIWKNKSDCEDSKDIQEIRISNICEVSKNDHEHNSAINKDDIHYEEKQDGDAKEYTDEDKYEGDVEGYSGIIF